MNVKSDLDLRMIKIKIKGTSIKRRKNTINLVKDYSDDLAIVHDEFNSCGKDINQHIIPIGEYTKPFKEKLRKMNYKLLPLEQRKLHHMRVIECLIRWLSWIKFRRKALNQNFKSQEKIRKVFNNSSHPVGRQKVNSTSEKATP